MTTAKWEHAAFALRKGVDVTSADVREHFIADKTISANRGVSLSVLEYE
jgi:hypothetical protein